MSPVKYSGAERGWRQERTFYITVSLFKYGGAGKCGRLAGNFTVSPAINSLLKSSCQLPTPGGGGGGLRILLLKRKSGLISRDKSGQPSGLPPPLLRWSHLVFYYLYLSPSSPLIPTVSIPPPLPPLEMVTSSLLLSLSIPFLPSHPHCVYPSPSSPS